MRASRPCLPASLAKDSTVAHARLNAWAAGKKRAEGKVTAPLSLINNDRPEFVPA
ncbi:hypothetical protein GmRootA79_53530 (plasmid) [Acidovorax sp. A79]